MSDGHDSKMDEPLLRLAQACGIQTSGIHEWPQQVDEDVLEFVNSVDARAIFVIEQNDGLIIGPPPRSTENNRVLVVVKPKGPLPTEHWDEHVLSVALPLAENAAFKYMHSLLSQAILPILDSQGNTASGQARLKIVEAERALAQLLRHTQVAFVDLTSDATTARIESALTSINECMDNHKDAQTSDLNELQSIVNTWKQQVSQLASSDREVRDGSASDEIGFWLALESALSSVQQQLSDELVAQVFFVLEKNKRFHATHNFGGETGLTEALTRAQGYTQILFRDLPIGEILASPTLAKLTEATEASFLHLNRKLRPSGYPAQRSVAFVEAVGKDFCATLVKISETELEHIFDASDLRRSYAAEDITRLASSLTELKNSIIEVAEVWDTQARDFASVARDLMRRRAERFVVVKVESEHNALVNRIVALDTLCRKHMELVPLLEASSQEAGSLNAMFADIIATKNLLQVEDSAWTQLEIKYAAEAHVAEKALAERLKTELSRAQDDEGELYAVFARHQTVMARPEVRIVAHRFQNKLLETTKKDLRAVNQRSRELEGFRGPIVERVLKMQQIRLRVNEIKNRLIMLLGPGWEDHADGAQVGRACDTLNDKLDVTPVISDWSQQLKNMNELPENEEPNLFRVGSNTQLVISEKSLAGHNSLRALKALGFRFDASLNLYADKLYEKNAALSRLKDTSAALECLITTMNLYPRIKSSEEVKQYTSQIMAFVRLGLGEVTWGSHNLSDFVFGFERAVSLLEGVVLQLVKVDALVTEQLTQSTENVYEMKRRVTDLLHSVGSKEYQNAVIHDLSLVIGTIINDALDVWRPNQKTLTVTIKRGLLTVSPDVGSVLREWFEELNELMSPVSDIEADVLEAYKAATTKIWTAWNTAAMKAQNWLGFQPLWDLNIDDVTSRHADDIEKLMELLEDLLTCREANSTEEELVHMNVTGIQTAFESKCDAWQNALVRSLMSRANQEAKELQGISRKWRKDVEDIKLDFSGLLEGIHVVVEAEKAIEELKRRIPRISDAQGTLKSTRTELPHDWIHAEQLNGELNSLQEVVARRAENLTAAKPRLYKEIESRVAMLVNEIDLLRERWRANRPLNAQIEPEKALKILDGFLHEFGQKSDSINVIVNAFLGLDSHRPLPSKVQSLSKETTDWLEDAEMLRLGWIDIESCWRIFRSIGRRLWFETDFATLDRDLIAVGDKIESLPGRTKRLKGYSRLTEFHGQCLNNVEQISLLLGSSAIECRHLSQLIPRLKSISRETVCVNDIWTKLPDVKVVSDVVDKAEGEYQLLKFLESVKDKWDNLLLFGRDGAIHNLDVVLELTRDNLAAFNAMRASAHFSAVAASVQDWERRVGSARLVFDKYVDVQRQHVYLHGVLTSDAVCTVLPYETKRFKSVAEEFAQIYTSTNAKPALDVAGIPRLITNLTRLNNQYTSLHRSLTGYLETQRQRFPRLYFVGDEDLLEIVGSAIEVWGFKHLPAIFPGVAQLQSDCVISAEGEKLYFSEKFDIASLSQNNVDLLIHLEKRISASLSIAVFSAIEKLSVSWPDPVKLNEWITEFPLQAALLALREQWSRHIAKIASGKISLCQLDEQYSSMLQWLATSGDDSLLWARRREALIAELTHEQAYLEPDFPELLITMELSVSSSPHSPRKLLLKRGNSLWDYGYEYLGAHEPIVQTKVTDNLFLSASSAIAQGKGGSIIGPAGTGKTESVKALGCLFGRRVIVFNCDNQFDFLTVCRMMNGCAATNSWVCFDEFNRLSREVLSSVAQVVTEAVQKAPVFVTMNPGYSGRIILPPNMRAQFREFVLEHPDAHEIARVLLCAHGKVLADVANATVDLLELMREKTSNQRHYDWGLRALKGALRVCRLLHGDMREACKIAVRPRLISEDKELFDAALDQLLPMGQEEKKHSTLATKLDLGSINPQLRSYVEELNIFRKLFPGVMLLGPSGCGKTVVRSELARLLNAETVVINPSAVSKTTLLGKLDPITREWKDGLLSSLLRRVLSNNRGEQSKEWFLVFDGEIEPDWAEALNSVLDENRHLTLASGEILALPPQVHLIFETTNLESATPATVSRCGMICMTAYAPYDTNSKAFIPRELLKATEEIDHAMGFNESRVALTLASLDLGSRALSMAWALAGDSNAQGRKVVSDAVRRYFANDKAIPEDGLLTDYYVSDLTGRWHSWHDGISEVPNRDPDIALRPDIVIPTAETMSHEALLQSALTSHLPLLLVGPPGSGKSMTLFNALRQLDQVSLIPLNFSSTTTPTLVIQALEMHCDSSTSPDGTKILSPPGTKWTALFIDELNLPQPKHDSEVVPVLQFIKYIVEYNGYLDGDGQFVKLERVQIVGACNPPPQRRILPSSLLRHFMVVHVDHPSSQSLLTIYRSFLSTFGAEALAEPMVNVYKELRTVAPNETWTPRELTRWMRGIYTDWTDVSESQQNTKLLARLWGYEACRVLTDRLDESTKAKVYSLLKQFYPLGLTSSPDEFLDSQVWTYTIAKRPSFVPIDELRSFLQARLPVFIEEASGEADDSVVIHTDFARHISRIDRILRQPQGHALLVGPSSVGKTTSIRFAAWLGGLEVKILRSHARYKDSDFAQDLRSVLLLAVRRPVCVLLGDDLLRVPEFVERMNSLLANGEVPGLFENADQLTELEEICQRAGFTGGDLVPWFRSRIVKNLHIMFTTTDLKNISPALLNRCVVDRIDSWSFLVKEQIAANWCANTDAGHNVVHALASLPPAGLTAKIPNNDMMFIESCTQFVRAYNSLKSQLEESQRHFVNGSNKLKSTVLEIGQLKQRLSKQQEELTQEDKHSSDVLSQMLSEQSEAERKRVAAIEIRAALQAQSREIESRQRAAHDDLAATEPLIKQAAEGVQNIKKAQLNELRSLMNPPEPVKVTLEAVCLVLGLHTDGSWKQVLQAVRGDEFIPRIVNFDSNRMSDALISRIEQEYMSIPSFTYERVNRASKAGGPLLRWVVAQVAYGRAISAVQPLLHEIEKLNEQSNASKAKLTAIEAMLADLEGAVERSKREYGNAVAQCETLKAEMTTVSSQLERAESLLANLSEEKQRWASASSDFPENMALLPGKALIEASVIALSGRLDPTEKKDLIHEVAEIAEANSIRIGRDAVSYYTGIDSNQQIVSHSSSVVLIVDPGNRWDPNSFADANLKVSSFLLDPDTLAKEVDAALRFGQNLVIKHAERFDPLIMPLLTRSYSRKGSRLFVNLGNGDIDVAPGFRLLLHARDSETIAKSSPLLLSRVNLVDFNVTPDKFQHMVADALLLAKLPDLAKRRAELHGVNTETLKKLRELEHKLLTHLADASASEKLLDNQNLVYSLETLKAESMQLTAIKQSTAETLTELDQAFQKFFPEAKKAAGIYEEVMTLQQLNRFYRMGVEWIWSCVSEYATPSENFTESFISEIRSRIMAVTKLEDWPQINVVSAPGIPQSALRSALTLVDIIRESPSTVPVVAGMATTNTSDPGDFLVAHSDAATSVVAMGSTQAIVKADKLLSQAMDSGEWLVIQNIEIANETWLRNLLRRLQVSKCSPSFRLILTGLQSELIDIPDLLSIGRPVSIERQHGVRHELVATLQPQVSDYTDFAICWINACFARKFEKASFSSADLAAARWFVGQHATLRSAHHAALKELLFIAVWGAKTGTKEQLEVMKAFIDSVFAHKGRLPTDKFTEWASDLPEDAHWLPEGLESN